MAKISEYPLISKLNGTEELLVNQNGVTKRTQIGQSEVLVFSVPNSGDTINISPKYPETNVVFTGSLTDDFTINVLDVSNCIPGHRLNLFLWGDNINSGKTILFSGALNVITCGSQKTSITTLPYMYILTQLFDGSNFTGTDNC